MASARERELADALAAVRARLAHAAQAAGRNPDEIELLPITKFFPAGDVVILRRLGCLEFGESREQEASNKSAEVAAVLGNELIRWHMVGHIQRNKARSIAGWAYAVHSVDSAKVIAALDRAAGEALSEGRRDDALRVYLQLSLDGDESRGGVDIGRPDWVDELCAAVADADGLAFDVGECDREREEGDAALRVQRAVDRTRRRRGSRRRRTGRSPPTRSSRRGRGSRPGWPGVLGRLVDRRRVVAARALTRDRLALDAGRQLLEHALHLGDGAATDRDPVGHSG